MEALNESGVIDITYCYGNLGSVLPVLFFSIAVTFNIKKWYYSLRF